MQIKITKEYFHKVEPEFYDSEILSGEGTLEEQVLEFELEYAKKHDLYTTTFKRGETKVEAIPKPPVPLIGDEDTPCDHE
jgi:hypothetical protein